MIMHQRTFYCKIGRADQVVDLVKRFKRIADAVGARAQNERVYTDLTGRNDRVVWQVELERMADWEGAGPKFFQHPEFRPWFEQLSSDIESSDSQFFTVQ